MLESIPPEHAYPGVGDLNTYLRVYDAINSAPEDQRRHFSDIFDLVVHGKTSTVHGRLERVFRFFLGPSGERGPGFDRLFKPTVPGGPLVSTMEATRLYERINDLLRMYETTRQDMARILKGHEKLIRVGVTSTFGRWLLSYIFSDLNSLAGPGVRVEIDIGNSYELVPRLDAGLLDIIFAYGEYGAKHTPQDPLTDVAFTCLNYPIQMVLICHPKAEVWVHSKHHPSRRSIEDVNKNYWKSHYMAIAGAEDLAHRGDETRKAIQIDSLDIGASPDIILVNSWGYPPRLKAKLEDLRRQKKVAKEVSSFLEALSLVRMGIGMAFVAGAHIQKKRGFSAFKLEPEKEMKRSLGVYYDTKRPLSGEAFRLVCLIREYIDAFRENICDDRPPLLGHPELKVGGDFLETFEEKYANVDFAKQAKHPERWFAKK